MSVLQDCRNNIDILLDAQASDSEVGAVKAAAREEGIHGSVEAAWSSRGLGESPWIIILLMPLVFFLNNFLSGAASEAGKDAYQAIRRLVSMLFAARSNSNGCVEFWDEGTGTHIILPANLPVEAYVQLRQKGLEGLKRGFWTWDPDKKEWTRL